MAWKESDRVNAPRITTGEVAEKTQTRVENCMFYVTGALVLYVVRWPHPYTLPLAVIVPLFKIRDFSTHVAPNGVLVHATRGRLKVSSPYPDSHRGKAVNTIGRGFGQNRMSDNILEKEQISIMAIETCAGWKFRLLASFKQIQALRESFCGSTRCSLLKFYSTLFCSIVQVYLVVLD